VCTLGILLVLAGMDVALVLHTGAASPIVAESKIIGATIVVAIPILRGLLMTRRAHGENPRGVLVTPQEQPLLWARVRSLAEQAGPRGTGRDPARPHGQRGVQ
jgi:hypothetical protein